VTSNPVCFLDYSTFLNLVLLEGPEHIKIYHFLQDERILLCINKENLYFQLETQIMCTSGSSVFGGGGLVEPPKVKN